MNTVKKYQKDASFITLYDKSIFTGIRLPSNPTHFVLWYKKDTDDVKCSDDNWGLTVKSFPESEEVYSKSHDWKLTWINNLTSTALNPTPTSQSFCDPITDVLYEKLHSVILEAQRKVKLKLKAQTNKINNLK